MTETPDQHAELVAVPFPARKAMQQAIFKLLTEQTNEWTTWSDAIVLAETAAVRLIDGFGTGVALRGGPRD